MNEAPPQDAAPQPIAPDPTWLAFARLCRLPNLFTAWADIFAGYFVVSCFATQGSTGLDSIPTFACLLVASSLIYSAGMILNDYFDREIDAQDRPFRPIPSGAIPAGTAAFLAYGMLIAGTGFALLGGYLVVDFAAMPWRGGAVAAILSVCVIAYDGALKQTALAPWMMGACRFWNILLGMSLAQKLPGEANWSLLGYDAGQLLFAGGIGLYIVGVTWFARTEAKQSNRNLLMIGALLMLSGIGMLAAFPAVSPAVVQLNYIEPIGWWGILVLLSAALFRRVVIGISSGTPETVQLAVKQAIMSLIFYNAAVALAVCGSVWAVAIVALLVPMLGLRRWMYST